MSIIETVIYSAKGKSGRRWDDRRLGGDRRSGGDRRGSGMRQPLSLEPRPYDFREFAERRGRQDRRLYRGDGHAWTSRSAGAFDDHEALRSLLSEEEIRYLFRCGRTSPR